MKCVGRTMVEKTSKFLLILAGSVFFMLILYQYVGPGINLGPPSRYYQEDLDLFPTPDPHYVKKYFFPVRDLDRSLTFDMKGDDVIVFLHIQKTGGTTFGRHLVQNVRLEVPCDCRPGQKKCTCYRPNRKETWLFSRFSTGWSCGLHADWTELTNCVPGVLDKKETSMKNRRSRLADFVTNCQSSPQSVSGCVRDNYAACLGAYSGLIGYDVALNFLDSDPHLLSIGPWCSCSGSGDQESKCEVYLKEFTQNRCLRNAIYAFGNGTDVVHKQSLPRPLLTTISPRTEKRHILPDNQSDSNTQYEMNPDICNSIQDKKNDSSPPIRICVSESQLNADLTPDLGIDGDHSGISQHHASMLSTLIALYLTALF